MCSVVKIDGFRVYVAAELSESVMTVNIKCCPRVPSKDIAVNWPHIVYAVTRSRTDDVVISNSPNYRHTRNTEYVYPMTDTYFVNNDESVNHDNEHVLICSTGDMESVACMQFAANTIKNTDTSTAELQLYVDRMNYSESTLIVYQMTTSAWNPSMTYRQVSQYISGIPIGTYQLKNPTLGDYNSATIVERLHEDDYHSLITIPISSSVMTEWLSGDGTYTPSIAIRIIGDGDQSVSFVSTSGNSEYTPRICLTGGESGEHPKPFEIHLSSDIIEPGNILRITPVDPTINSFGNSIFNLEVDINDTLVTIEHGDSSYLDVLVPDTLSGVVNVYVKQKGGDRITDDATVYVDASNVNRNVALAKKLKPGVIDPHKVNSTALYNRDMGFVDMTEVTDETSLIQNVYMILLTNPGERLFSQDFGTGIEQKLFKLGSVEEGISLLQECIRKVSIYEPRVYIDGDQSTCEFDNSLNHYTLILCCVLPTGRSEYIKLPFKNRGTVI
jgi:phage baseplate assembly protein W